MAKKIVVLSGSPVKMGNTASLTGWFAEGAVSKGAKVEIIPVAFLKLKVTGCNSCRACQKLQTYECVIDDEGKDVLAKMAAADVIVMATPLYFFGPSAQIKTIIDRMFSLYKWDNKTGAMQTILKGKTLLLIASSFEDLGMKELEAPFRITADYSGMKFESLLVPYAGESGEVEKVPDIRQKAYSFGEKAAR